MSLHDSNNDSLRSVLGPSPTSTAVQHPISSRRRLKSPCVLGFRHPRQRGLHPTPRRPPISAIALRCCAQESYRLSLAAPSAAALHTVSTPPAHRNLSFLIQCGSRAGSHPVSPHQLSCSSSSRVAIGTLWRSVKNYHLPWLSKAR
jgi:hypothetical protein